MWHEELFTLYRAIIFGIMGYCGYIGVLTLADIVTEWYYTLRKRPYGRRGSEPRV